MPSLGNLFFKIGADVREAVSGINKVETEIKKIAGSFGSIGRLFAGGLAADQLLQVGKNAIIASAQFEKSFLKIKNLTDASTSDIKTYKAALSGISSSVGVSIKDLANGLYSITSAGASGARALETLEISAKAAAVGMGSTDEVARALTATINAYGEANLSSKKAAEIFFKTTKSGSLDIAELTATMQNVTPLASALGVSFEQVGAFLAAVSLKGTKASEAVTQLSSILSAIINPTDEASKILKSMGISMDELQEMIKSDFRGAMLTLEKGFAGSATAMSKFFGRKEAVLGFLSVIGDSSKKYGDILEGMVTNTVLLDTAYKDVSQTLEHRYNKALATFNNTTGKKFGDWLSEGIISLANWTSGFGGMISRVAEAKDKIDALNKSIAILNVDPKGGDLSPQSPSDALAVPVAPVLTEDQKAQLERLRLMRAEVEKIFDTTAKNKDTKIDLITNEAKARLDSYKKELDEVISSAIRLNEKQTFFEKGLQIKRAERLGGDSNLLTAPPSLPQKLLPEEGITKQIDLLKRSNEEFQEGLKETSEQLGAVGSAAVSAFANLAGSLLDGSLAFKDLGRAALQAASQIIKAALAEALAAGIAKSIKNNPNILVGIAIAGVAVAAILSLFKSKVPKLAKGGLAFGPQLALVGDNPGASRDPEVIAPLSKLQGLLRNEVFRMTDILSTAFNQSLAAVQFNEPIKPSLLQGLEFNPPPSEINVVGRIDGTDIMLVVDRNTAFKKRRNG